jgi:hypothetical protein
MASTPYVRQARGVMSVTFGSTAVVAGDLVYFDGTDWERADADTNATYAEAIAVSSYNSGDVGNVCTSCILVDLDAPYTQGATYYLEAPAGTPTAGNVTATRPTVTGNVRQVVGFGISTSELRMEVKAPYEVHEVYRMFSSVTTEAVAALDSGNFYGVTGNADDEVLSATWSVPQNCVGLVFARIFAAGEVVTGATDLTITVSGAADGEQWDATAQDATLTTLVVTGAVADEMQGSTITTALDAAGIIEPDNCVGFKGVYDGGQTDVVHFFNIEVTYLVV